MTNHYKFLALGTCLFCLAGMPGAQAFDSLPQPVLAASPYGIIKVNNEANAEAARAFIDGMAQRAIGFLGENDLTEEQRKAEFKKLLHDSFDMKTIGRFSLGKNWKSATAAQQSEYQTLFEKMIIEVYSRRFSDYNGQKLEVRSTAPSTKGDTLVTTFIVPENGPEVQVDWRVRHEGSQNKIVDVLVEGVSMALTQRSDFDSVIQRGGGNVEVLLEHLRQQ